MRRVLAVVALFALVSNAAPARAAMVTDVRVPLDIRDIENACWADESLEGVSGAGSFLQRDPHGYEDSVNLYAGFAHDPINNRDPTGMGTKEIAECLANKYGDQEYCELVYGDTPETSWWGRLTSGGILARLWGAEEEAEEAIKAAAGEQGRRFGQAAGETLVGGVSQIGGVTPRPGAREEFEASGAEAGEATGRGGAELAIEQTKAMGGGKVFGGAIGMVRKLRPSLISKGVSTGEQLAAGRSALHVHDDFLRAALGSNTKGRTFKLTKTLFGSRKYDAFDPATRTAFEVNTQPWASISKKNLNRKLAQVAKDVELQATNPEVGRVVWIGTEPLPTTGPASQLRRALEDAGIPYWVVVP